MKRGSYKIPNITDWKSFTPTGSWTANGATYQGYYRRVGDTLCVRNKVTLGGAPDATTLGFNIPFGLVIDTSKMYITVANTVPRVGQGIGRDDSGSATFEVNALFGSTTTITITYSDDGSAAVLLQAVVNATAPITFAANDSIEVYYEVPILGWASNRRGR